MKTADCVKKRNGSMHLWRFMGPIQDIPTPGGECQVNALTSFLGTELRDKQALRCIRSGEYFLQILEKCISEGMCVRVVTRQMIGRKASIDGFNVNVRRFRADGFHDGAP